MTSGGAVVVIVGPTATGKSATAISLAETVGGEIVSADSRTLYRGMDVGTAKPSAEVRRRVRHHLVDIAEPDEVVTVARVQALAQQAIAEIAARGRLPIAVGGTGLYVRAVIDGLAIPPVPPDRDLRSALEAAERDEPGVLHRRLAAVDPAAAAAIHPRNVRRIVRALEVHAKTGRPITEWQRREPPGYDARWLGLSARREALYRQIDARVEEQIAAGLVEETRRLLAAGYDAALPSMQGLGYKEMAGHLRGQYGFAEAVRILKRNTRRYAKRQLGWFRRDARITWLDVEGRSSEQVAVEVRARIGDVRSPTTG